MRTRYRACCYADGHVRVETFTPEDSIEIATGPARVLRAEIEVVARHSYDGTTMLVPGVPEALELHEKLEALCRFVDWAGNRLTTQVRWRTADEVREAFAQLTATARKTGTATT